LYIYNEKAKDVWIMFYRCPKCGVYRSKVSWALTTGLQGNQLSPFYCCPSCGEASANEELESFIGRLKRNMSGLLSSIIA